MAAVLPPSRYELRELASSGLLVSPVDTLAQFGFARAYISAADEPPEEMALTAARAALADAGVEPDEIDVVIWASARPENHLRRHSGSSEPRGDFMDGFRYASGWLQDALDLSNADVMAVTQQGCSTMFAALRLARSLLIAEPTRTHVLCVGVDVLPPAAPREILYNVISDAACAVVVSRGAARDRWVGYRQISRGYYWDPAARRAEIVAAYFPTAKILIDQLLADHGLRPEQIDFVVPTGVSQASWQILMRLVGIPDDRLYRGVPSFAHTITSDNFVYLQALRQSGVAANGSRLLLFTYGFGSSWCGLLLEH